MMNNNEYQITEQSFTFVQSNTAIHDTKFETKRIGYFRDALRRFRKNKGSVVAAIIILLLVIFAIFSPIVSKHNLADRDLKYKDRAPLIRGNEGGLIFDGGQTKTLSYSQYQYYKSIAADTGYDPITRVINYKETEDAITYKVRVNSYYAIGTIWAAIPKSEYLDICKFQDEKGLQVLLPYVESYKLGNGWTSVITYENAPDKMKTDGKARKNADGNICYAYTAQGYPVINKSTGGYSYVYSTVKRGKEKDNLYHEYNSLRVASDPGRDSSSEYVYAYGKDAQGQVEVRLCYYNYYQYKRGETPQYIFGTDIYGKDIFYALGKGARFSLLLAVFVSAINFILGTIYGSIEGYYGGAADMIMERISDILSGVPLMIVVTLFNLHLAKKVGVVPAFLLAFIATGWIGTAGLVRKQFYRFKGQEYVLASRTLGAKDFRIMFKHIFPNSLGTIVTSTVLVIPGVIGSETMLTYLGIINLSGEKVTSIGALMADANGNFDTYPHELFFPALFLSLLMISFNLFGNGLRDAFNPALRGVDE